MTNCEEISARLAATAEFADALDERRNIEHLASCEDCQKALLATEALRAERFGNVPPASSDAILRLLHAVQTDARARQKPVRAFWSGLGVGAAAVTAVALLVFSPIAKQPVDTRHSVPVVTLAILEPQDISIAINSPETMQGAEMHVMLRGAIDLAGYEGQRDLTWPVDLERGVNELTLPVIATGTRGGRMVVEVRFGDKRKTFQVDVQAAAPFGGEV